MEVDAVLEPQLLDQLLAGRAVIAVPHDVQLDVEVPHLVEGPDGVAQSLGADDPSHEQQAHGAAAPDRSTAAGTRWTAVSLMISSRWRDSPDSSSPT